MNENSSYVGDCQIVDNEAISAYPLISGKLQTQSTGDDFMNVITNTLLIIPSFIGLDQVLYILDDKHSRSPELVGISGREMLANELDFLNQFNDEDPEFLLRYISEEYNITLVDQSSKPDNSDGISAESEWIDSASDISDGNKQMTPDTLLQLVYEIKYCYQACYELREYVNELHQIKLQFQKEKPL